MKTLLLSLSSFLFALGAFAQSHQLSIHVTGLRVSHGTVQASLFNQAETFPDEEEAFKFTIEEVSGNSVMLHFSDLPPGDYAVALFHDENGDDICNLNFFGIPKEGYGFSRNYVPTIRVPRFEETQFTVSGDKEIKIKMIY